MTISEDQGERIEGKLDDLIGDVRDVKGTVRMLEAAGAPPSVIARARAGHFSQRTGLGSEVSPS